MKAHACICGKQATHKYFVSGLPTNMQFDHWVYTCDRHTKMAETAGYTSLKLL